MAKSIRTLALWMVNAYLVKTDTGFILIDTGFRFDRKRLDRALSDAGGLATVAARTAHGLLQATQAGAIRSGPVP